MSKNKKKDTEAAKPTPKKGAKVQEAAPSKWFECTRSETFRILSGLILLSLSLFLFFACLSYIFTGRYDQMYISCNRTEDLENWAGAIGAYVSDFAINKGFGLATFFLIAFMAAAALKALGLKHIRLWKWFLNCSILLIWFSLALDYWLKPVLNIAGTLDFLHPGGAHGENAVELIRQYGGSLGVFITLLVTAVCYMVYVSGETIRYIQSMLNPINNFMDKRAVKDEDGEETEGEEEETATEPQGEGQTMEGNTIEFDTIIATGSEEEADDTQETPGEVAETQGDEETDDAQQGDDAEATTFTIEKVNEEEKADSKTLDAEEKTFEPYDPKKDLELYKYPTLSLLEKHGSNNVGIDIEEQTANKDRIIKVLRDFGVEISTIKATVGPTITLYEIQPAPGVKISKIRHLEDDIALSLAALGIRIIAPIPGKGTIGIEVPNAKAQIVSMESILNSKRFKETDYELPCAVGKTISNEVYMFDLAKMPHLLVAGATGQGKSV
ncbi:MAG: DNA translocase FtsK 4TM domain-containing protein, partial [Bacteroidaceae bacterium]|nr:DNA translocase FtsK 4TM domain-containing protein [Bacteroidaceae bacterium]